MKGLLITPYHRKFGGVEVMNEFLHRALARSHIQLDQLAAEDYVSFIPKWKLKVFGLPAASAYGFKKTTQQYDFVICNGEFAWGIRHPRVICLFHGTYRGLMIALKKQFSYWNLITNRWLSFLQKMASKNGTVVTVSKFNSDQLKEQGINVSLIIENPVELDKYLDAAPEGNGRGLFVGSYQHFAKGFDQLERLAEAGIDIDCVTNKIPAPPLGHLGEVKRDDLYQLYSQYDFLIHPSRFESSCLVALEAMAAGIPVLMNPVGVGVDLNVAIPQFVLSFDDHDISKIKERLEILRRDRKKLGVIARQYVEENHSFIRYAEKWQNFVQKICSEVAP